MKKEEEKNDVKVVPPAGQCVKDSDCGVGEVCVGGKCVPDIAPPPPAAK